MAKKFIEPLQIENAQIMFKNFTGRETKYTREGTRNFCVRLDDDEAVQKLIDEGWNVRLTKITDEDEKPQPYIQVAVAFENRPPKVWLVVRKKKTLLTEETIGMLDDAEIINADLIIRPYPWEVNGKSGIKAYLKTAYITIEEDRFAAKYAEEEYPPDDEDDDTPW